MGHLICDKVKLNCHWKWKIHTEVYCHSVREIDVKTEIDVTKTVGCEYCTTIGCEYYSILQSYTVMYANTKTN